jgi:hypothetical protein
MNDDTLHIFAAARDRYVVVSPDFEILNESHHAPHDFEVVLLPAQIPPMVAAVLSAVEPPLRKRISRALQNQLRRLPPASPEPYPSTASTLLSWTEVTFERALRYTGRPIFVLRRNGIAGPRFTAAQAPAVLAKLVQVATAVSKGRARVALVAALTALASEVHDGIRRQQPPKARLPQRPR